ncbi:MAG: DUF4412 domain-containing protein [Thermoanaerobaculia bacterium]
MKKTLFALVAVLLALPALGGATYDFKTVVEKGAGGLVGKASIEGSKVRIDIADGDDVLLRDGNVMISADGGKTFTILDQKKKTYYTLDIQQLISSLGSVMNSMGGMFKMSFQNHSVKSSAPAPGETIEGFATTRYVVDSSYDLAIEVFGRKNVTNVKSKTETWSTDKLSSEFVTFVQQKGFKTGLEELDKFIEKEASGVKGFPLKQVVTSTQTQGKKSETTKTTMTVTSVKEASIPDSTFAIPSGYKEVDNPLAGIESMMKQ